MTVRLRQEKSLELGGGLVDLSNIDPRRGESMLQNHRVRSCLVPLSWDWEADKREVLSIGRNEHEIARFS